MDIKIQVLGQKAKITNRHELYSGTVAIEGIQFEFSNEWADMTKTATVYVEAYDRDKAVNILIENDRVAPVQLPSELFEKNCELYVGVFGIDADGRRLTSSIVRQEVKKGVPVQNASDNVSIDVYTRIIQLMTEAKDIAADSNEKIESNKTYVEQATEQAEKSKQYAESAESHLADVETVADNVSEMQKAIEELKTAAEQSASDASTSEQNASTSEQNASTSEQNAKKSEQNASKSATDASTSASNAKKSETAAATSEQNARKITEQLTEDVSQLKEDLAEIDLQINGESGEYIFNWQIGYISNTNGSTIYTSKDKICTKDGEFYSFDPNLQNLIITIPDGYNLSVFIYDENNTYVNATGYSATDSPKNFPIKSTMKYRYAIIKSGESVGDVKWANDISFKNTMIDHSGTIAKKVETLIGEVNALKPVQNIVKLLTLGDSITALGTGERGWIKYFIEKTNATLVANVAVNSAKLADDSNTVLDGNPTQTSNNTLSNQVQKVINNTYDEPDIIIIAIGTNNGIAITKQNMIDVFYDSDKQLKPLDEVDRTNDYGAFRWCFEKLHSLYPNAQIFWSTPIHGAQTMRRAERIIDCRESLQIATEYVGCVMIDSVRCGINGINEIMNTNGEYLIDGLHTNVNGAKKLGYYIASKVKPFIGNNFEEIN